MERKRLCYLDKKIYTAPQQRNFFERLAWFYATIKKMLVYDADRYCHELSDLILLSRGNISFRPRFALQYDFEQKAAYLQESKVQNFRCTFEDWVKLEWTPDDILDQRNSKGQWPFLSMEGSQLRTDLLASSSILNQLKNFRHICWRSATRRLETF